MRSNLRCRRVTRLLLVFTKAPFDNHKHSHNKMMEFLRLESIISRPVVVGCECGGCDNPSEPVEVILLVTPLGIFSLPI